MKNIAAILFACAVVSSALGQTVDEQKQRPTLSHGVYLEGLGNAGLVSLNYELVVNDRVAVRAGLGSIVFWVSYPLTASYLIDLGSRRKSSENTGSNSGGNSGGGHHRLELGAGVTLVSFGGNGSDDLFGDFLLQSGRKTAALASGIFGYRYHRERGLLFRIGFTPLMNENGFVPYGGTSIGYRF